MNQILNQLLAVFRLEIRKTFFARRGLWIYLLAAAPFVIILGHIYSINREHSLAERLASRRPGVTLEKMRQIRDGMTREQVVTILSQPSASSAPPLNNGLLAMTPTVLPSRRARAVTAALPKRAFSSK